MSGPTVTIPAADYRRLIEAAESDDMIERCEVCGAWLDVNEDAYCPNDDVRGCWKVVAGDPDQSRCRSYRATVLEGIDPARPGASLATGG